MEVLLPLQVQWRVGEGVRQTEPQEAPSGDSEVAVDS